jgi:hypothetical protein
MPVVPVIKCILLLQEIHKKKIMYTEAGHYIITLIVDYEWFSLGPPVYSTNKTDRHDITEILLKVALNTIKQTNKSKFSFYIPST